LTFRNLSIQKNEDKEIQCSIDQLDTVSKKLKPNGKLSKLKEIKLSPEKRFLHKVYQKEEEKQNISFAQQMEQQDEGTMKSELDIDEYLLGSRQNSKGKSLNIFIDSS
jgi:hypothetical protein